MLRLSAFFTFTVASLVLAVLVCTPVQAAEKAQSEYFVKAALVYNFARFTEWPHEAFATDQTTFRIAVYGDENLTKAFAEIEGRAIADRKIEIVHLEQPQDVVDFQLLFLANTERGKWPQILAALNGDAVLTIGEMNGFLEAGGMMNLHMVEKKIRFQVNLNHARDKKLTISSRILKLATEVVDTVEVKH